MTTAFCYVRASTIEEAKAGSNEMQKGILDHFCKSKNWDYKIYEDKGKTGANMDRDGFKKMMMRYKGKTKICPSCGYENPEEAVYCMKCATKLN